MANKKPTITDRTKVLDVLNDRWMSSLTIWKHAGVKDSSTAYREAMQLESEGLAEVRTGRRSKHGVVGMREFKLKD